VAQRLKRAFSTKISRRPRHVLRGAPHLWSLVPLEPGAPPSASAACWTASAVADSYQVRR